MVNQHIGNHGLGILRCGGIRPWAPLSRSSEDSQPKSAYNSLLLVVEVWDGKPTYRKSWDGNLSVWSDLTLGLLFKVIRG